jgi:O-antigen ligase
MLLAYWEPALALILMLAAAPLKTLIETEAGFPLPLDIGQWALAAYIGVWGLRWAVDKSQLPAMPWPIFGPVALFLWAALLSLGTAESPAATLQEGFKWVEMLILLVLVANTRRWEWAVVGVVFSGVLQAALGVWQFMGGSGAPHLWILDYEYFRAFGSFGQPNPFGAFMGMILPLSLGLSLAALWAAAAQKRLLSPASGLLLLCGAATGILLLGLLASWSRGAWLGFLAAGAVVVWAFPQPRWLGHGAVIAGALGLGVLWNLGLLPASLTARLTDFRQDFSGFRDVRGVAIDDANFAVIERLAHWQAALEMAKSSPYLGQGFGNYEIVYPGYALIDWPNPLGHAHNYYLNLLAETGLLGLVTYLLMWGFIFVATWGLCHHPGLTIWGRGTAAGLLGTWTHISVHSLLDKLYVNNLFLHVGVMLGIVAGLYFWARSPVNHKDML